MMRLILLLGNSIAVSIVVKATVVVALGLVVVWLGRRSRAAVRHAVLAATFAALLGLPIASLLIPPVRVAVRQAPSVSPSRFVEAIDTTFPNVPMKVGAPLVSRWAVPSVGDLLFAGWIVGVVFFLLRIVVGLRQVSLLRRFGLPWLDGQAVLERIAVDAGVHRRVDVLLHESLVVPVTCGVVRPAIVLPPDAQGWDGEDLGRAILHEVEHVRRWDWVSQCVARVVCAVYWFHPLVWLAWRGFVLEAERACDDAVLRRSEVTAYADQLVALAQRLSVRGRSPALAMANRSDLSSRVRAVLDATRQRGRAGIFVMVACAVVVVVVLAMSPLRVVAAPQFTSAQFEVASVKRNASGARPVSIGFPSPGVFNAENVWLRFLIQFAWQVQDFQVVGGPGGTGSDRYDIIAKAATGATNEQMLPMLQALLEDRFQLVIHSESRDLPVYALVVSRGGVKLKATKDGSCVMPHSGSPEKAVPVCGSDMMTSSRRLSGTGISMADVVTGLSRIMQRPVVDRTGLAGIFDVQLEWTADQSTPGFYAPGLAPSPGADSSSDPGDGSIFTAVQEQLGLKIESSKGPVTVWVIDRAEKPSAN